MPRTLPEIGTRVRLTSRGDDTHPESYHGQAIALGPSTCKTDGRIGVQRDDDTIDLLHHADDLPPGTIGWADLTD